MGNIFKFGQNQCHRTRVKKSYFCHIFHLRPKKVMAGRGGLVGGGLCDNRVSSLALAKCLTIHIWNTFLDIIIIYHLFNYNLLLYLYIYFNRQSFLLHAVFETFWTMTFWRKVIWKCVGMMCPFQYHNIRLKVNQ